MAWQDALLPASFRGIPFFVDTHEKTGGRNAISHEPPDRESSFAEDMGKKADGYRITGHILGDTYFFIRDALISAMETREPGILIHPYLGLIDVQPSGYRFAEDTREGRICRFELNFVEAGNPNTVFAAIDAVTGFITDTVALVAQAQNAVELVASFTGLPGFAIDSAEDIVTNFIDAVRDSAKKVKANVGELSNLEQRLDEFEANVRSSLFNLEKLSTDADAIIANLKTVPADTEENDTIDISSGKDDKEAIFDNVFVSLDSVALELDDTVILTPTRERENVNNQALNNLFRQLLIARKAEVMADKAYKSAQEALRAREDLTARIDEQLAILGLDDNLFQALKDMKASIAKLIPDPRKLLGTERTIVIVQSLPSLVLAYDLYDSLDNETDLLDRNGIEDPSFIAGELEVISCG